MYQLYFRTTQQCCWKKPKASPTVCTSIKYIYTNTAEALVVFQDVFFSSSLPDDASLGDEESPVDLPVATSLQSTDRDWE